VQIQNRAALCDVAPIRLDSGSRLGHELTNGSGLPLPAVTFEISEDAMIHDIRANRTAVDQQNGQTSREPLNKSTRPRRLVQRFPSPSRALKEWDPEGAVCPILARITHL